MPKKIVLAYNVGGVKNQLENLDDIYKINLNNKKNVPNRIKLILNNPPTFFDLLYQ